MVKKGNVFWGELKLSSHELEVITLKASLDMINDMVNHDMMNFFIMDEGSEIYFKSSIHASYFSILLVDFLSIPTKFFSSEESYLKRLEKICKDPKLSRNSKSLANAVDSFDAWLLEEVDLKKHLPSLDLGGSDPLNMSRKELISMFGNISKHNFTNLTDKARKLKSILEKYDPRILMDECLLMLMKDIKDFSHDGFIPYHGSSLAEFLNNIRWGIYEYISPIKSYILYDRMQESINTCFPEIKNILAKHIFYELMGAVKYGPCIPKFQTSRYLKSCY